MSIDDDHRLRDRYETIETIGRGGQGKVLKAHDLLHDRLVAIKVRQASNYEDREALLEEARILLDLEPDPGFTVVRDDFFEGDHYYLVMDWVEGINLATLLRHRGDPGLPYAIVLRYVEQVARTLDHLHAHDPPVVHQDVKPANLILTPKQRVVLVDFGIAGSRARGTVIGTPDYCAPEVLGGEAPAPAADIFGLAATTFALLTGGPPRGDTVTWEDVPREDIDAVEHALGRGLTVDPLRRPGSAEELVERLRARLGRAGDTAIAPVAEASPIRARAPTAAPRRRRRVAVAAAVVALVAAWFVVRATEPGIVRAPLDSIARIDAVSGALTDAVDVGDMPTAVVAAGDSIWVANLTGATITRIDAEEGEVVDTIATGGSPTDMSATSDALWVANELQGSIVRIDRSTGEISDTLRLPIGTKNIAATDAAIWVTQTFDRTLIQIEPRTRTVVSSVRLPGAPADIAVGFGSIWVTEPHTKRLLRVDPDGEEVVSIALRGAPEQIAVGEEVLWVSSPLTNQVFRIDPDARTSTAIDVGNMPTGIAIQGDDVWVANYLDGTVTRIDAVDSRVVDTVRVGNAPEGVAASGDSIWVTVHAR